MFDCGESCLFVRNLGPHAGFVREHFSGRFEEKGIMRRTLPWVLVYDGSSAFVFGSCVMKFLAVGFYLGYELGIAGVNAAGTKGIQGTKLFECFVDFIWTKLWKEVSLNDFPDRFSIF